MKTWQHKSSDINGRLVWKQFRQNLIHDPSSIILYENRLIFIKRNEKTVFFFQQVLLQGKAYLQKVNVLELERNEPM